MNRNSTLLVHLLPLVLILLSNSGFGQTSQKIVIQPGAKEGKDAYIYDYVGIDSTTNLGNAPILPVSAWTHNGMPAITRALMQFSLTVLPKGAQIKSALLTMFYYPTDSIDLTYHSNLSGSNASVIKRIVSPWTEDGVNWSNQPYITDTNQVFVPQSTSPTEDFVIDVTNLVIDAGEKGDSVGFLMRLITEKYYRALVFASSDNSDSTKWPKLEIEYTVAPENCLVYQPGPSDGKDATILDYNNQTSVSRPSDTSLMAYTWTHSGFPSVSRFAIGFDLSAIPFNVVIDSAYLGLFHAAWDNVDLTGHSTLSGSNATVIQRITSSWNENVTWATMPTTTTKNQVELPETTSPHEDFPSIDVTNLVSDQLATLDPEVGFLCKLQDETAYRAVIVASSDNVNAVKRPRLTVCYHTTGVITSTINLNNEISSVTLAPNPFSSESNVIFSKPAVNPVAKVYDLSGKEVQVTMDWVSADRLKIERGNIEKGLYMLVVMDGGEVIGKERFVVVD